MPSTPKQRLLKVKCPRCDAAVVWGAQSPFRPFCSARCKGIDLGAWANDEYRIPSEAPPDPGALDESGN